MNALVALDARRLSHVQADQNVAFGSEHPIINTQQAFWPRRLQLHMLWPVPGISLRPEFLQEAAVVKTSVRRRFP